MSKKKKKAKHITYNEKAFLLPNSINSMASIHCKIGEDGIAKVSIADCNHTIRLWNDFNDIEGKEEMLDKITNLMQQLSLFKQEVKRRTFII